MYFFFPLKLDIMLEITPCCDSGKCPYWVISHLAIYYCAHIEAKGRKQHDLFVVRWADEIEEAGALGVFF